MELARQLKCKHCGEWNEFTSDSQVCKSCKNAIHVVTDAEVQSLERRKTSGEIKIPIHPDDNWFQRNLKHVFNIVQVIFLAIVSFFLWLFVAGPG
jgi:hypothetical protein